MSRDLSSLRAPGGLIHSCLDWTGTHGVVFRAWLFVAVLTLALIPNQPTSGAIDNGSPTGNSTTSDLISAPSVPNLDAASDTGFLNEVARTATLRPNADMYVSNLIYSTGTTAWSLIDEVNLDINDWVQTNTNGYMFFAFPDGALPTGARVTSVVIRANVTNSAPAGTALVIVRHRFRDCSPRRRRCREASQAVRRRHPEPVRNELPRAPSARANPTMPRRQHRASRWPLPLRQRNLVS